MTSTLSYPEERSQLTATKRADQNERRALRTQIRIALNGIQDGLVSHGHWLTICNEVAGKNPQFEDITTEELRAIAEAVPEYVQRVESEHAARNQVPVETAADRLAAIEAAIRDGADVNATVYAAAKAAADAEAQAAQLREEGVKARAKAERDLAKRQNAALTAVRENLPAPPSDFDERIAAAEAAIAAAIEAITGAGGYAEQVTVAHRTLTAGGIVPRSRLGGEPAGLLDRDNTIDEHGNYIVIDGTMHAPADELRRLRERLALLALGENFEYRRGKVTRAAA